MIQGDRNTNFYHVSTLVRRKRNQILAIKNHVGEWIHEESAVKEMFMSGFNSIYTSSFTSGSRAAPNVSQWQARLSEEEKESIGGIASEEEIKSILWSLKAFKAPGPDGLHAGFFHRFWLIVGKPYLDKLISPLQMAFVQGRKGIDNAIIVQEVVHTISKKKGRVGYMALKIDLEKAYDKIEWSFIRDMLIRANLPFDLIDIIMSCISTVSTSILFNGEALDPIFSFRGIRQGDPLSPYLFILCMEFLGQLIEEKSNAKLWQPVKASCSGPAFSHLFFADDLVLFAKADHTNCSAIRDVLDDFCSLSGQSVSDAKSRVYFSPNVDRESRESFCDILGFASTPSLGKYLGIPIKHPGSSSRDFNFILDRVKTKLAGWKANLLSLAGRVVLIQAISAAIPAYVKQCTHIPNKILEGIDRVNRNFLWGSSKSSKKIHWVGWQKVTKSKEEGGLGLQTTKGRNTALLAKLNWRLHVEEEAIWKGRKKGRATFNEGSMWIVGRDSKVSFWWENWTGKGTLRYMIQGYLTQGADKWKVGDILSDLCWDWDRIPFELPLQVQSIIQATPNPFTSRGQDKLAWSGNSRGIFDLWSAYSIATKEVFSPPFNYGWIWKLQTLLRIKTLLWLCTHNSIGVKVCLVKRGVVIDELCPICQREPESIIHAIRDCAWVKAVWV
ncbi:hypothetical protein SO802_012334 [Lithocarpus litseifolius]|uniref:Reverse transcriptase domain-containing protein n=1 Tax=Lithocarpus litseifolius TaxID=425828 RepID=A0AAW2D2G7_9ROSI